LTGGGGGNAALVHALRAAIKGQGFPPFGATRLAGLDADAAGPDFPGEPCLGNDTVTGRPADGAYGPGCLAVRPVRDLAGPLPVVLRGAANKK